MFEALANYIRWALEMIQLGNILRRKSNIFNIKVEHHSRIRTIGDPNLSPIPYRSVPNFLPKISVIPLKKFKSANRAFLAF